MTGGGTVCCRLGLSPYDMTDGPRPATLLAAPITPLVRLLAIPDTHNSHTGVNSQKRAEAPSKDSLDV